MFEKNTKQVNRIISKIYALCSLVILFLVICSCLGVFEFGKQYTLILLIAGLIISISPSILIRYFSDHAMKYYMMIILSIFIGILGTNNHIGIFMTYALAPIFSCLYFDPVFTGQISCLSYIVMAVAVYVNSATKYEVAYMGRSRMTIFTAYLLGFTIEYIIINLILYFLVKQAKKLMEERYSAEEENRLKSRFLSSMSHEIRTPMNAIIGMSEVALRQNMSDELRKYITVIKSSSTGLLEIINDILDLSRIKEGKINIVIDTYNSRELADDMIAIVNARNLDHKVPIYYHIQDNMPPVMEGDAVRIKQVMLNLASNAIKYTDSGQIDIYMNCEELQDGYANLTYTVKDTGQGIRTEDIDKLFTMYTQFNIEKNYEKEGAGIGLAISKSFVELMNGTIHVTSKYQEGSTFSFTIPQKIASGSKSVIDQEQDDADNQSYWFTTKNVRVLLVDDNDLNREVEKAMLEPLALIIDEAANGIEAINMAKETPYDLIFMDSHMPMMDGEEATRNIRRSDDCINQNVPIIAVTADAISGVRERLLSSGMNDYIVKPFKIQQICELIRKYLPPDKIEA